MIRHLAALGIAYVLGSISPSFLVVRRVAGEDLRAKGSGSLGGRNVWRVLGFRWGALAAVLDGLKGILAVYLGVRLVGDQVGGMLGLLGVIAGHNYSIFLGFAGGKGMAAGAGGMLVLSPRSLGILLVVGAAAFAIGRNIYLANVAMACALPVVVFCLTGSVPRLLLGMAVTMVIVSRHLGNLREAFTARARKNRRD